MTLREVYRNGPEMTSVFVDDAGAYYLETVVGEGGLFSLYAQLDVEQVARFSADPHGAVALARELARSRHRFGVRVLSGDEWQQLGPVHYLS